VSVDPNATDVVQNPDGPAERTPELSVVMPAYCEERRIVAVVSDWMAELDRLDIDYVFRVYDDGSKDGTREVLERLAAERPRLVVRSHSNRGHGPTILAGYEEAQGDWVFQTDSDDELPPGRFADLWEHRHEFDILVGNRQNRRSPLARKVVAAGSRCAVWLLFGKSFRDVNTPYRLMRRSVLVEMIRFVPRTTFAPNVILAGLAARMAVRVYEAPVPHRPQQTITAALNRWGLWKTALRCARESARVALAVRRLRAK
jgi:dolichol-phosphate mannosyltransferase